MRGASVDGRGAGEETIAVQFGKNHGSEKAIIAWEILGGMTSTGCWMLDAGCWMLDVEQGFRAWKANPQPILIM